MMNDTSEKIQKRYQSILMGRPAQERLKMGCSMFETAKRIVESSIKEKNPEISPAELKVQIFLRMYSHEFSPNQIQKICNVLRKT